MKKIKTMVEGKFPNDEVKRNYKINKKLIDLKESPNDLYLECINTYHKASEGDRSKLLNYFTQKRLRSLVESIGEF